jgi:hypothetical protein
MSLLTAKMNRSKLYHAISMTRPINSARTNRLDFLGSLLVPFLCVVVVHIVRFIIRN